MIKWVFIVVIIHRLSPVIIFIFGNIIKETFSLNAVRYIYSCHFKNCGSKINIGNYVFVNCIRFDFTRVFNYKWHSYRFFVHKPFIKPPMFSNKKTLIRCVNNNCIFLQLRFF